MKKHQRFLTLMIVLLFFLGITSVCMGVSQIIMGCVQTPSFNIPHKDLLWAWYKFDEGAGLIVYNHAGNSVENMAWDTTNGDPTALVWSVPGFGHNVYTGWGLGTDAFIYTSIARPVNYTTVVAFIRPLAYGGIVPPLPAVRLGQGGGHWSTFKWTDAPPLRWQAQGSGWLGPNTAVFGPTFGTWYCVALQAAIGGTNYSRLWVRGSGMGWTLAVEVLDTTVAGSTQTLMTAFGLNSGGYPMDGGDFLYYAHTDPHAYLTLVELENVYQVLKGRYGMI